MKRFLLIALIMFFSPSGFPHAQEVEPLDASKVVKQSAAEAKNKGYEQLIIKDHSEVVALTLGRFINRSSGIAHVRVEFAYGSVRNFVLPRGQYEDMHLRTSSPWDQACWSKEPVYDCGGDTWDAKGGWTYNLVD